MAAARPAGLLARAISVAVRTQNAARLLPTMATLGALGVVYGDIGGLGEMTHLEGLDAHAQHKARERVLVIRAGTR